MKNLHWTHLISFTGFGIMVLLALYSPHTRSSMSQPARELSNTSAIKAEKIEVLASPLGERCWNHLEPAAKATQPLATEFVSTQ
jgi:hypothetical protein